MFSERHINRQQWCTLTLRGPCLFKRTGRWLPATPLKWNIKLFNYKLTVVIFHWEIPAEPLSPPIKRVQRDIKELPVWLHSWQPASRSSSSPVEADAWWDALEACQLSASAKHTHSLFSRHAWGFEWSFAFACVFAYFRGEVKQSSRSAIPKFLKVSTGEEKTRGWRE